jgi:phosphatidylinositol phospholipase C, delta
VDIYDGDNEPMIFHGKTLTSKVSVREVCEAIKKYGFVSSPYPIIISAEIHCGLAQQDMLAHLMKEVFGNALIVAPDEPVPPIPELPSPEHLKGKILLKVFILPLELLANIDSLFVQTKNLLLTPPPAPADPEVVVSEASTSSTSSSSSSDDGLVQDLKADLGRAGSMLSRIGRRSSSKKPREKPKMSMALVGLLVYTVGVKCRGINKKEEYAPEHMFSLSENAINRHMKSGMMDLIKHNKTHLVRVYPKGMRLNSTNYEPHRYWAAGAQLVALNWQTFGRLINSTKYLNVSIDKKYLDFGYMINHAMFQRNGRAGYVLKPAPLREGRKELLTLQRQHYLDLTVISAQQLPLPKDGNGVEIVGKSVLDPYVEVSLHVPDWVNPMNTNLVGSPNSNIPTATPACTLSYRTSVVKNNGFNPVWEEKIRIPFTCVEDMLDLVFVRFKVKQEDGDDSEPLAYFCASLGQLQAGEANLCLVAVSMN